MLKNRKSISAFAVVAALLLSISAPTLSTAAKTPPVQLKSPQNIVVTPVAPGGKFTVSWSVVPYASSYTVRVYNSSGKTLVGSAITAAVSGLTVTKSANTSYRVTVQAIGNGSTYSNSPESGKYSVTTFASTYAITWNDQSPTTASSGGSTTYTTGSAVTTIPTVEPTKTGYSFGGWFTQTAGAGTQVDGTYTPASPYGAVTFYAKWIANTNNAITWDDQSPTTASSGGSTTYTTGSAVTTIPTVEPTKTGYSFGGWFTQTAGAGTQVDGTYTPASPYGAVTFYAKWIANTNNAITWDDQSPTTASSGGSTTYTTGSAVTTIPTVEPTKTGYSFGGWFTQTAGAGTQVDGTYTPASPYGAVTFYAKWIANTNNAITWDDQSPTTASSGGSTTYTTGSAVTTIPTVEPTKTGYSFGGWFTQTAGAGTQVDGTYTPASPYGAVTFYAKWIANTNNAITWDDQSPTTASSGGSTTYTTGSAVTTIPTVEPTKTGYSFGGWFTQTAGAGTQVDGTYTPASPYGAVTFYAKWIANTNNAITWDDQSPTTASSGGSTTYTTGSAVTTIPTVEPTKTGYSFGGWFTQTAGAGTQVDGTYTPASPYGAVTFYAKWIANTNNAITWDDQSPTTASSGGSTTYTTGSAVTTIPTVEPTKTGYSFGGWFTQTAGAGTQVDGTYTPASPYGAVTFYAKWIANTNNAITWDDQSPTTASSGGSTTYTTGSAVTTIPTVEPTKTGYSFGGWFTQTAGAGTQVDGTYTPASPYGAVTFYAKWIANTNNAITWDDQSPTTASSGGSTTYTTGSAVTTIPTVEPTKTGYSFGGWFTQTDGAGTQVDGTYTPASPYGAVTFYAKWLPD